MTTTRPAPSELPFVAPCRRLAPGAPLRWLRRGWQDLRAAPAQSLAYGLVMLALAWGVGWLAFQLGSYVLLVSVLSGFIFLGPVLAIGLYEISRRLEQGEPPTLAQGIAATRRTFGNAMVFGLILMVIFLVWARAGSAVSIFFPEMGDPGLAALLPYFAVGSAVGAIFAAVTFGASAFALPMIADRQTDSVTAVVTSLNAVLRNKPAMAVWATLIVGCLLLCLATGLLGVVVLIPLLGHATWHGYRETIDASDWPAAAE